MSRAFKKSLIDEADDLSTGALDTTACERLSGADLEQMRLASLNNMNPAVSAGAVKTVGTSLQHAILATVTSDGISTITVDRVSSITVGTIVDIVASDGVTSRAAARTITAIAGLTLTYNGADASAAIVAGDLVLKSSGRPSGVLLTGADLERYAGDQ